MQPNAGATRHGELTAALVAVAVLGLFVGAFAVAGAFEDDDNRVTASSEASADNASAASEQQPVASAGPDATTMHQHDDATAHEHPAGETDATHSHDDSADAAHEHAATGGATGATHSHDSTDAAHDDAAHNDTAHDDAAHNDAAHSHDPAADPAAAADHPDDGHTHPTPATVPGDTTPTTHSDGHNHGPDTTIAGSPTTTGHSHTEPTGPTVPGSTPTTDGHHHGGPVVQFSDLPADIQKQIGTATMWAAQYNTTAKATAAGFPKLTQYFPGIAAHYINLGRLFDNQPFDWQNPEVLLFNGTGPDAELVGINYIVNSGDNPPEGFPGDYDQWHEHANLCLRGGIVVGEVQQGQSCPVGQTTFSFKGFWLLHVWSIPGWEAPEGIFAHENSRV